MVKIINENMSSDDNESYPTQWALNPNAYQNMDASQVDWATLAQQWIMMKESGSAGLPPAPPPPDIKPIIVEKSTLDEKGEAPMDVETGDNLEPNPQWSSSWGSSEWNQWGWNGAVAPAPSYAPPAVDHEVARFQVPVAEPTSYHLGYWTASAKPEAVLKSKSYETRNPTKTRMRPPVIAREMPKAIEDLSTMPAMDAARRRQLPGWIREGLEKMEREKQKQLEKEQLEKERELMRSAIENERAAETADGLPPKSKFDSDSDPEIEPEDSKADLKTEESEAVEEAEIKQHNLEPQVFQTKEEIMQEVMLCVRRSITEILLEVTDNEIRSLANEEYMRYNTQQVGGRNNASASSKGRQNASLGLTANYGSGSESESDSDQDDVISDEQLEDIIQRRKVAFERISREIERQLVEEEENAKQENDTVDGHLKKVRSPPPERCATPEEKATKVRSKPESVSVSKNIYNHSHEINSHSKHEEKKQNNNRNKSDTPSVDDESSSSGSSSSDSDSSSSTSSDSSRECSRAKKRKTSNSSDEGGRHHQKAGKDKIDKDEFSIAPTRYRLSESKAREKDESRRRDKSTKNKRSRSRSREHDYDKSKYSKRSKYSRDRESRHSRESSHRRHHSRDKGSSRRHSRESSSRRHSRDSERSKRRSRDRESSRRYSKERHYKEERYYESRKRSYRH